MLFVAVDTGCWHSTVAEATGRGPSVSCSIILWI